ncbi:hypothetical protein Bca52824_031618 [Brassica carinata]|uniref:Uncharacterized protein n=1 Tax=Brassica carinata TaxID=52824 RepID=A0A8X7SBJ4_BRACI|nr:hypothetical protein Bca52824_031618 [Brassica carinata]
MVVRVRKMVMKDSIEEMFPHRRMNRRHTHSGFWITPVKRKQTKAGGSSKAEPPIKKQKKVSSIVEDEAAVEGKGASEKEGTEDIENKKRFDIADLVEFQWRSTYLKFRTTIFIVATATAATTAKQQSSLVHC